MASAAPVRTEGSLAQTGAGLRAVVVGATGAVGVQGARRLSCCVPYCTPALPYGKPPASVYRPICTGGTTCRNFNLASVQLEQHQHKAEAKHVPANAVLTIGRQRAGAPAAGQPCVGARDDGRPARGRCAAGGARREADAERGGYGRACDRGRPGLRRSGRGLLRARHQAPRGRQRGGVCQGAQPRSAARLALSAPPRLGRACKQSDARYCRLWSRRGAHAAPNTIWPAAKMPRSAHLCAPAWSQRMQGSSSLAGTRARYWGAPVRRSQLVPSTCCPARHWARSLKMSATKPRPLPEHIISDAAGHAAPPRNDAPARRWT